MKKGDQVKLRAAEFSEFESIKNMRGEIIWENVLKEFFVCWDNPLVDQLELPYRESELVLVEEIQGRPEKGTCDKCGDPTYESMGVLLCNTRHEDANERFVVKLSTDVKALWPDCADERWLLIDTETNQIVGCDGGEPEDQLLVRDWTWVEVEMNSLAREIATLKKENADLKDEVEYLEKVIDDIHPHPGFGW